MWGSEPFGGRRLFSLVSKLPPESALAASLQGEAFGWRNSEELLALIAELLDLNNRLFVQANSKPGSPRPKPLEIPRPYRATEPDRPQPKATADEITRFFKGHIKSKQV